MTSSLCCNPITFDDEMIDMELEEVWELQRTRSRDRQGEASKRGRQKLKLLGNSDRKVRRGLSISRDPMAEGRSSQMKSLGSKRLPKRSMSTGRMGGDRGLKKDRSMNGRFKSTRSNMGRDNKKVSISKYVEKIELQERQKRNGIAPPIQRRVRSNSMTRAQYDHGNGGYEDKNRFNTVHLYDRYEEPEQQEYSKPRRKFSFRRRKKEKKYQMDSREEWSSSSESEDDEDDFSEERGGFFAAFR